MSLKKQIEGKLNEALKAKNKNIYPTLRLIVSAIKDAEIAGRSKGQKEIKDADIIGILKKSLTPVIVTVATVVTVKLLAKLLVETVTGKTVVNKAIVKKGYSPGVTLAGLCLLLGYPGLPQQACARCCHPLLSRNGWSAALITRLTLEHSCCFGGCLSNL